jgi:hypothetical protein
VSSRIRLAISYIRQREPVSARLQLISLLKDRPGNADAWFLLAHLSSDRERKLALLQKAIALQPDHPYARKELSKLKRSSPVHLDTSSSGFSHNDKGVSQEQVLESIISKAPSEPTFLIDEMVDSWLRTLTYTERYVINGHYSLEGEMLTSESVNRAIRSNVYSNSVEEIRQSALAKLRESRSRTVIAPLSRLVSSSGHQRDATNFLDGILVKLVRTIDTTKYNLHGVVRLLLDVEDEIRAPLVDSLSAVESEGKLTVSASHLRQTTPSEDAKPGPAIPQQQYSRSGPIESRAETTSLSQKLPYKVDWTLVHTGNEGELSEPPDLTEIFFEDVKRLPIISNRNQQFWLGAQLKAPERLGNLQQPCTRHVLAEAITSCYARIIEICAEIEFRPPLLVSWLGNNDRFVATSTP